MASETEVHEQTEQKLLAMLVQASSPEELALVQKKLELLEKQRKE